MVGRFKLDENLPRDAEAVFRNSGHDVEMLLGEQLGADVDSKVFDVSRAENRTLVTLDLDFADIQLYPPFAAHSDEPLQEFLPYRRAEIGRRMHVVRRDGREQLS